VERAMSSAAMGLVLPVGSPRRATSRSVARNGTPETALVVVSDLQLAKVTPTYNTAICERRMSEYADTIERLVRVQRADHPVNNCRVYFLGDIVEGEQIFPGQAHHIDASLFRQVGIDGPRILTGFLKRMESIFPRVHACGVIGNHGSMGDRAVRRLYNPETNADRLLYHFVRQLTPSITWDIPYLRNERAWYTVDYPHGPTGPGYLLFHGDQLSANPSQWPRRIALWAIGGIPDAAQREGEKLIVPFRYAIFGHWHRCVDIDINEITAYCNGSTESTNTYAQEQLSSMGKPKQWVLFSHPRHGVTASYKVKLT
jgi:hypothetical protein